jgi:hypothetical protein
VAKYWADGDFTTDLKTGKYFGRGDMTLRSLCDSEFSGLSATINAHFGRGLSASGSGWLGMGAGVWASLGGANPDPFTMPESYTVTSISKSGDRGRR